MRIPSGIRRRFTSTAVLLPALFAVLSSLPALAHTKFRIIAPVGGADLASKGELALVVEGCRPPKGEPAPVLRAMLDGVEVPGEFRALPWEGRWSLVIPASFLDQSLSSEQTHWLHVSGFCPNVESDSVTFTRGLRSTRETAARLVRRFMAANRSDKLKWDWSIGTLLYGLDVWSSTLPQPERAPFRQYLQAYFRRHATEGFPKFQTPAQVIQGTGIVSLAVRDNDLASIEGAYRLAEWVKTAPRNGIGAIDAWGTSPRGGFAPEMITIDELMALIPFSIRWARYSQDQALLSFALGQMEIFASRLQDPATGLFKHAWRVKDQEAKPSREAYWLRGNAYAGWAMVELLQAIGPMHPEFPRLHERFTRWASGVRARQLETGLYDQVLNLPGYTDEETSGSAWIAATLARGARLRFLDPGARDSAAATWRAIASRLVPQSDGTLSVTGVSRLTTPRAKFEYGWIGFRSDLPHGVAAVLLLASEF